MSQSATADESRWGVPFRVVALQVAATALTAGVALAWGGAAAASALLGGAVACVPNACFAWTLRGGDGAAAMGAAAGVLVRWVGKIALTVGLLMAALVFLAPAPEAFVAGLAVALLAPFGAPLVIRKQGPR